MLDGCSHRRLPDDAREHQPGLLQFLASLLNYSQWRLLSVTAAVWAWGKLRDFPAHCHFHAAGPVGTLRLRLHCQPPCEIQ